MVVGTTEYNLVHFDLDKIARSGQVFRWEYIGGLYKIASLEEHSYIWQQKNGSLFLENDPDMIPYWEHYLGIDYDYLTAYMELMEWPGMKEIVEFGDGIRIVNQDWYEAAITFIISQNNNIPRISGIMNKLAPSRMPYADELASMIQRRDYGLGYRQEYVQHFCEAVSHGWTPPKTYKKAMTELQKFKGIGEKVANCICLYGLGMMEAHPVDVWIERALSSMDVEWHPKYAGLQQQLIYYWIRNKGVGNEL